MDRNNRLINSTQVHKYVQVIEPALTLSGLIKDLFIIDEKVAILLECAAIRAKNSNRITIQPDDIFIFLEEDDTDYPKLFIYAHIKGYVKKINS